MFYKDLSLIEANFKNQGERTADAGEIAYDIVNFHALTVYPRVINKGKYRTIDTAFSYVPIRSVDIFHDSQQVIALTYKDNYYEKERVVHLDPNNKVYTTNKGYISAGNLGGMDVLMTSEGRIASIISKSRETLYGNFFKLELKYGNNIMVNGLVVIPK